MNEGLVVLVRGIIAFFTLLIFTRILGKQQISQLTFFEYILGITIGSIASELTVDLSSKAWPHFVGLLVWFLLTLALQFFTMKSKKIAQYVEGEPTVIIMNGQILEKAMKRLRLRITDLIELLRQKDVFDFSEVEIAIMEVSGTISVMKKPEYQNVTLKDLKIQGNKKGLNTDLIYDGEILEPNLKKKDLSKEWLYEQLDKYNIKDPSEVFYATLNSSGKLYIDKYEDEVNLKKIPATYSNKDKENENK